MPRLGQQPHAPSRCKLHQPIRGSTGVTKRMPPGTAATPPSRSGARFPPFLVHRRG